ncbi:VWA domain-containing protein [Nanoarchaeota archaeon]
MVFSIRQPEANKIKQEKIQIPHPSDLEKTEELSGKLAKQNKENKLMSSVMENDKKKIDQGNLIEAALNQGMSSFSPDTMFERLVQNYSMAKNIFGDSLIRAVSGYEPGYVEKNINIPEFRKELKKKIEENVKELRRENLIDKENNINEEGIMLASLVMYTQELDNLKAKGLLGEIVHKKASHYGEKQDTRAYKKGDRFRDIELKKSIKTALRRSHSDLQFEDLKISERQSKGQVYVIYAVDASGSMKGKKLGAGKKAGIALAFKALQRKDKVGLIVFGDTVKSVVPPTNDFKMLLHEITKVQASNQTDLAATIRKSIEMFPTSDVTKHLLLLTDALPTVGEKPEKETLKATSEARAAKITISVVGINLDKEGQKLAEKVTQIGEGRLYIVKNTEEMDKIILEDYYAVG